MAYLTSWRRRESRKASRRRKITQEEAENFLGRSKHRKVTTSIVLTGLGHSLLCSGRKLVSSS